MTINVMFIKICILLLGKCLEFNPIDATLVSDPEKNSNDPFIGAEIFQPNLGFNLTCM